MSDEKKMSEEQIKALRKSITEGARSALRDILVSPEVNGHRVVIDVWCDDDDEWKGQEVIEECEKIWRQLDLFLVGLSGYDNVVKSRWGSAWGED